MTVKIHQKMNISIKNPFTYKINTKTYFQQKIYHNTAIKIFHIYKIQTKNLIQKFHNHKTKIKIYKKFKVKIQMIKQMDFKYTMIYVKFMEIIK